MNFKQVTSDEVVKRLQVPPGACLQSLEPGGAAAVSGLMPTRRDLSGIVPGDVIIAVNEKIVQSGSDLSNILDQYQVMIMPAQGIVPH
jgi:S1-C subfamily serine protease